MRLLFCGDIVGRPGRDVVVVDKARFPRDKCCGDGLTAAALRELEDLGLSPDSVAGWQPVVDVHLRVMTGGNRVGAEGLRALDERRELQVAVAVHAGDGRASGRVLAHEVRHDVLLELVFEVDDVVGNADRPSRAPRVVQVVDRAAAPEGDLALLLRALSSY